jgi:glycosyltransferase involved in cell wall biosynthesis
MKISVVICAHNPDMKRLERVFDALRAQRLPLAEWECLLIDNASAPGLADRTSLTWHPSAACIHEGHLGLTWARMRGVASATGDILVFVDDDCLLESDYLLAVRDTFQMHPFLGALGGYGQAEYEVKPPEWSNELTRVFHLDMPAPTTADSLIYARVRQLGPWFPVGAGMAVRRELAIRYAESIAADPVALALDRSGSQLTGGGDTDLGMFAIDHGFAIGKSGAMRFTHVVPAFRFNLGYMLRLLYMSQYSVARLLVHRGWKSASAAPASSLRQKLKKVAGWLRRYSPEDRCWQAYQQGYADGLRGAEPDSRFIQR